MSGNSLTGTSNGSGIDEDEHEGGAQEKLEVELHGWKSGVAWLEYGNVPFLREGRRGNMGYDGSVTLVNSGMWWGGPRASKYRMGSVPTLGIPVNMHLCTGGSFSVQQPAQPRAVGL